MESKTETKNTNSPPALTDEEALLQRDVDLQQHLKSLSLDSIADYIRWCRENGLGTSVRKDWRKRCHEKYIASQSAIDTRRRRHKAERKDPATAVREAIRGASADQHPHLPWLKQVHTLAIRQNDLPTRDRFEELLLHLCNVRSPLLSAQTSSVGRSRYHNEASNSWLEAVAALTASHQRWIRSPVNWKPRSKNIRKQFASLARHLLAKWRVPVFMDCVWLKGDPTTPHQQHDWFIRLANGTSVRKLDLPIPLSKKMVHPFLKTPDGFGVIPAIRRAQVLSCGGNESLVLTILDTRLARTTGHNDFWLSIIRWLARQGFVSRTCVGALVDFFHFEKFEREGRGVVTDFSIAGKTVNSVIEAMHLWHAGLRLQQITTDQSWPPHPNIGCFYREDPHRRVRYCIRQLLSVKELYNEGRKLRHCVVTYSRLCLERETTIWSMRVQRGNGKWRPALTIEVTPHSRRIVQARGRGNRSPRESEKGLLKLWACQQELVPGRLLD